MRFPEDSILCPYCEGQCNREKHRPNSSLPTPKVSNLAC
jgi:hypothetical protein